MDWKIGLLFTYHFERSHDAGVDWTELEEELCGSAIETIVEDGCEVDSDSSYEFRLIRSAFWKEIELKLCIFFKEVVFIFLEDDGGRQRDSLVKGDFLVVWSGLSSFSDRLLVIGFPLDIEERGEPNRSVGF